MLYRTRNIYEVNSLSGNNINNGIFVQAHLILDSRLLFYCTKLGVLMSELDIITKIVCFDLESGIKILIDNLMLGKSEFKYQVHNTSGISRPKKGIDQVRINLDEPYKSLFEDLFNPEKWNFEPQIKKLI